MKKHRRSNNKRKKHKISNLALIVFSILGVVLIGDIIGAVMYLRQTPEMQESLTVYLTTGDSLSFFQIFWRQFLYQSTIWTMGLTVVGNLVNLFLIFVRGVSAGFNLAVLVQTDHVGIGMIILWLIQYMLVLFTTILSVYFSIRFAYLLVKSLMMKKYKLIKKHLKLYMKQFIVVMLLTIFTSMFSAVTTPIIHNGITDEPIAIEMEE